MCIPCLGWGWMGLGATPSHSGSVGQGACLIVISSACSTQWICDTLWLPELEDEGCKLVG